MIIFTVLKWFVYGFQCLLLLLAIILIIKSKDNPDKGFYIIGYGAFIAFLITFVYSTYFLLGD